MIVRHQSQINGDPVVEKGAEGVHIQWLLGRESPAPRFFMRLLEIAPEGHTPFHSHDWEHEVFILEGEGSIRSERGDFALRAGTFILVEPEESHQFVNTGGEPLRFLCMIPRIPGK